AFGGRREIMEELAPLGPVYQAGTYSGNPIGVSAALATLESLRKHAGRVYPRLEKMGDEMRRGIGDCLKAGKVIAQVNGVASMFQWFFTERPVIDDQSVESAGPRADEQHRQSWRP